MAEETETDKQRVIRHDIKNQLSNIYLAIEALRYEIADPSDDCTFYIDSIAASAAKINSILAEK